VASSHVKHVFRISYQPGSIEGSLVKSTLTLARTAMPTMCK
jgi:hypothetical protein